MRMDEEPKSLPFETKPVLTETKFVLCRFAKSLTISSNLSPICSLLFLVIIRDPLLNDFPSISKGCSDTRVIILFFNIPDKNFKSLAPTQGLIYAYGLP